MKISNTSGITLEFTPWTNKNFKINKLHMIEKVGGELAHGEISMVFDGSDETLKFITDQKDGVLKIENTKSGGNCYEIPVFIISRSYYKNFLTINFICIPKQEFYTVPHTIDFDDITDAINYLYPGTKDIQVKSDVNNDIKIYQAYETDYTMCTKLALSLKKDIIMAYSWEGLVIKELYKNNNEKIGVIGDQLMYPTSAYLLNYNILDNNPPYNPREKENSEESDEEAVNCEALINFNDYSIFKTQYNTLYYNYNYNKNLMESKLNSTLKITGTDMPGYKIGDTLIYKSATEEVKIPFSEYIVASNELFFAVEGSDERSPYGFNFEWTSILWGIDSGIWCKNNK